MRKYKLLLCAVLMYSSAYAQTEQPEKKRKRVYTVTEMKIIESFKADDPNPTQKPRLFLQRIKIRKAFESADDRDEPAAASFTMPNKGKDSYLINGGISYNMFIRKHNADQSSRWNIESFVVFNRNTLLDEEQFNVKGGVGINLMMGKLKEDDRVKFMYTVMNGTVEYMRDKVDTTHSAIATGYFSIITNDQDDWFVLGGYRDIGKKGLQYMLQLNAGPEYQNVVQAETKSLEGYSVRFYYAAELRIAHKVRDIPTLPATAGLKFIELILSAKGRSTLIDSYDNGKKHFPLGKVELAIYPTLSSNLALSFSYNNGSDPIAALPDQEYYLLSVKFKK